MRISDWSSDVCSSDLLAQAQTPGAWDLPPDELRRGAGETRVINRFLSNLKVAIQGSSRVIAVSYTTTDPPLSQQIANAEIGRASSRERVWQDVEISVVAVT